jgi:hypothetical protein
MRSQVKAGSSHGYALPWRIPRDGHVVGDLLRVASRCEVERWPTPSSPGCRRSYASGDQVVGWPAVDGSDRVSTNARTRHRGSVGARPRYGGRPVCLPGPSDSPSLETHEGARRPAPSVGTSARLAAAPCTPFLRLPPRWRTTLRPTETNAIQRSTQRASRQMTACERLDNDAWSMSDGVLAG